MQALNKSIKVLILGGNNRRNIDLLNYAKELGVHTIITDYLPVEKSPLKLQADEYWNVSTGDIDEICNRIARENISAVTAAEPDFNISMAQKICDRMGLNFYANEEQLNALTNKSIYSKLIEKFDLPTIEKYYIGRVDNIQCEDSLPYPVIIKPVDGSGGRGVNICFDNESLYTLADDSAKISSDSRILIEKYFDCEEVALFFLVKDGQISLTAMADRIVFHEKRGSVSMPISYDFPSKHLDTYLREFNSKVISMLESQKVQNGSIFMQCFWDKDQCYIYDIGYRLAGTQVYLLLEKICGFNTMKMLLNQSITGIMDDNNFCWDMVDPYFGNKWVSNYTFINKCGVTLARVDGIEQAEAIEGVEQIILSKRIGDFTPPGSEGRQIQVLLRALLVCDSAEKMIECKAKVRSLIKAYDENGDNIIVDYN